ncbi:MAG TPA: hypothetical protein VJ022_01375 [Anaerolineales bacterium]|nr:hypothetical protein [Anaerolineales bacterium]
MPVLKDIVKGVIPLDDIGYFLPSNAIIHKFRKTMLLPINVQDGKAISFAFN